MASDAGVGLRYKDKVVIVTGGSKGIGEGVVRVFVKHGSKVVFCARGMDSGKDLEEELRKSGPGECMFVTCDVTREDDIKRLIDVTVEKYGRIDCLVNNAGQHPPFQSIDDVSAQDFRDLLNMNLVSYFLAAKYALPYLRKTEGNIINMSSLVGMIGQNGAVPYVSTKGGIIAMTKAMAVDESKHNVRVNCISPGNVWTPMWEEQVKNASDPEAMLRGGNDAQLIGRMGTLEESGNATLYLAAEATFCTGINLVLSGGAELNYACKNQRKSRSSIYE
ncbi:17-beta-hydroxysteroid dehydrogenase 14 [Protopterus annectens]|uniref:17-beta-hydroxysteroid dehydrogenase 14 n=1 Tax=Protopterus annectens TaxID=7888 RepID=UPI001CF9CF57|nr:17-beta-hydroxysteroid dehydrogenase 14 [Protopterus annectens]